MLLANYILAQMMSSYTLSSLENSALRATMQLLLSFVVSFLVRNNCWNLSSVYVRKGSEGIS